ncbi:MAG: hypothetical protein IJX19_05560 [Clostridia bacterium]|nr:hypothetical protein [Clostridia bacterium]
MKNSKLLMRILCLLMALCTVCAVLASCAAEDDTDTDASENGTEASGEGDTSEEVLTDKDGFILDAIPDDLKIKEKFSILGWKEGQSQYYRDELGSDVVGNAVYLRNMAVEDRLEVELDWTFVDGDWEDRNKFAQQVEATSSSGMAYDAVVCYNLVPYVLAVQGLVENLYGTDYIDLTAPWWPSAYMGEALYNDTIYGLVESCAFGTLRQMTGVFFNNDLIDDKNLKSPYDMVAADEWTFDNMMTMLKGTYEDRNSNGTKDANDFYGITTGTTPKIDSWFYGMGYRWSDFDGEGNLELLAGKPEIIEYTNRLAEAFGQDDFYPVDSKHALMFTEERAIMYMTSVVLADGYLKKLDMNYGIVPVPKGSADQKRYYTHLSNTHDAWCVPVNVENISNSSAVIECMASESYRKVDPVYYETCIKLRYATDEKLGVMYDLIRDSITFDFFYLFAGSFSVSPLAPLRDCCRKPESNSWSSVWSSNSGAWQSEFDNIVALYGGNVKQ